MIDRALKPMAIIAALVVLAAALAASLPSKAASDACLERSLQDLVAWRWIEPRLSGGFVWQPCTELPAAGRVLAEVRCPSGHSEQTKVSFITDEGCDAAGRQHAAALRALVLHTDETDEAVETLEPLAAKPTVDAHLLSDLAAAYLVRARRTNQPADLLRSFDAAWQAVAMDANLPEARFNLSLAAEALKLPADWEAYLSRDRSSPWAAEAQAHQRRLASESARLEATSWALNRERLIQTVNAGDRRAIAELIQPFPAATQRYLEEEVLPGWARELSQGRQAEAERHLTMARALASELSSQTGDSYMAETVGAINRALGSAGEPEKIQALIEGHLAFGEARLAQQANEFNVAEEEYRQASTFLAAADSPLRAGADLGLAIARFQNREASLEVLGRVEAVEREARLHHYWHLLGRALWIRGLCLSFQGRSLKALTSYDEAIREFEKINDREDVANVRARKAGVFRVLGESGLAWEEIFHALPDLPRIVDLQSQHHLLGEAAAVALARNHLRSALSFQTQAVNRIEEALRKVSLEGRAEEIKRLRFNLAVSFRARATIELQGGMQDEARRDLAQSRQLLEPEMLETLGREQLASAPRKAIEFWTEALHLSPPKENRSFLASLHFQLALAYLSLGQRKEAEEHFQSGVGELRDEEKTILDGRQPGQGEELWTAYFSRFQRAQRSLIRLLLEDHRWEDAFAYAEEARAFEPLDLVLRHPFVPGAFRRLVSSGEPLKLSQVQEHLPAHTFLVEYCVLEDRMVLWVVWRAGYKVVTQKVSHEILTRWTEALQVRAQEHDVELFEKRLTAPFPDIVSEPLRLIKTVLGEHKEKGRIVFVPDGPLHGLPLSALRDQATGHRVIEDFPVSIAPSATLYVYTQLRDAALPRQPAGSVLLVGDPASATSKQLVGAVSEVRRISLLYPGAMVLTAEQATAERFLSLAKNSVIVHFAGHAFADPRYPSRSYLLFAPTRDHPGELYAEELLRRLQLGKTRLVVLSSCSSAGGGPIGPEGLAPLVRSLIAAGSPAVVGSLWKVQDQATEELLVRFHQYYVQGEDAARALRHAQLDFKDRPVLFWAPFQVIGHAGPPFPPQ